MSGQISSGAQICDLIHMLFDPIEYVSGVVSNFVGFGYDPESSVVRNGITGTGVAPNYKIEERSFRQKLTAGAVSLEMTVTPARTFSGRNHREMTELDDEERHSEHWSTESMSFAELKILLSSLSQSKSKN
jgi:hypothetical protein